MRLFWRVLIVAVATAALTVAIVLARPPAALLALLLILDGVVLVLLARWASRRSTVPLADLRRLAIALTHGERGRRARLSEAAEVRELAVALNDLAEHLDRDVARLHMEQAQTAEILGAMRDGVLLLDARGYVLRTNPAAARMLGVAGETLAGQSIVRAVRTFPAVSLIEQALRAGGPSEAHVDMPGGRLLEVQILHLDAHPLPDSRGSVDPEVILLVMRDATERVRTERMRRDFAANVSHELKTPLAGITLLVDTLQHAVTDDPDEARRFAHRLSAEVARLTDLVTDLLTLSRLEEATPSPTDELRPVDLGEVVRATVSGAAERARASGVAVEALVPAAVTVKGNPVDLETMLRNLLDNAVRFTDPGGHVWVTLDATPSEALLTVRDDGIGIPRDDQQRIFERFYRVDKARSRETGGTGLGLSIVRHVAEGHGGRVDLESTVGVGSTFTVYLPLATVADTEPAGDGSVGSGSRQGRADGDTVRP